MDETIILRLRTDRGERAIKDLRHKRILEMLGAAGAVEIARLARMMPEVSQVTLRRDIAELAEAGALRRTRGGAVLPDAVVLRPGAADRPRREAELPALDRLDAVILPPIAGRGADALRRQIVRRGIPFLAESAPQAGGCYLGPDNLAVGRELGRQAGHDCAGAERLRVLVVGHADLANTQARARGFVAGLGEAFAGALSIVQVNGQGSYRTALPVAADAMAAHGPFDVVLGVNDHSAIAGAEAAQQLGHAVAIYAIGGENPDFVARLADGGPLRAVAALFPEVVGARAIDLIARRLAGGAMPAEAVTPHAVVRAATFRTHFERADAGWRLRRDRLDALAGPAPDRLPAGLCGRRVGFMPHFPAHDWYRAMIQAMQARAGASGLDLVITPPHQGISAEISRLRGAIAETAAATVVPGETLILNAGEATACLAEALLRRALRGPDPLAGLTVVTNSLDILHRLDGAPRIKTILTSGEYQSADRCLVGPSLGALFERVRADRAFVAVGGITPRFGLSSLDERLALATARIVSAARRTVVLADHTLLGVEANHRIARIDDVDMLITDDGAVPADRQSFRDAGCEVLIAREDGADTRDPLARDT